MPLKETKCIIYQTPGTVKNFLIGYIAFTLIRKRHFNVNDMNDLFEVINIDENLSFFKQNYTERYKRKTDQYLTK